MKMTFKLGDKLSISLILLALGLLGCKNTIRQNKRSFGGATGAIDPKQATDKFVADATSDRLNLTCDSRSAELPEPELSILSREHYVAILQDLMGTQLNTSQLAQLSGIVTKANAPEAVNGYVNNAPLKEDKNFAVSRFEIGEFFAEILTPRINANCNNKACSWQNLSGFLQDKGEAIYGFSFQSKDIASEIKQIFDDSYQQSSQAAVAFQDTLTAFFASPYFHLRNFQMQSGAMDQFAIAQKLSFYLLGSIPDENLLADAKAGKLSDPKVRVSHVERLLSNTEVRKNFSFQFISQYFRFNNSYEFAKDNEYNGMSAFDVFQSAIEGFDYLLKENKSLDQYVAMNEIFANEKMASIYDLKTNRSGLTKIPSGDHLSGLLFHPINFLSTAGGSERTLYVYRGLHLMSRYLCIDLPPLKPADFKELEAVNEELKGKNLKTPQEIIRFHRANENCNICHQHIDGLGVAFEHYDSLGNYRTVYEDGQKVDASGELLGKQYKSQQQMRDILANSNTFKSCMIRQMNSFASQYSPFESSGCLMKDVLQKVDTKIGFMDLVKKIVESEQFVLHK